MVSVLGVSGKFSFRSECQVNVVEKLVLQLCAYISAFKSRLALEPTKPTATKIATKQNCLSLRRGHFGHKYFRILESWCREGGRTPTRLPSADFESDFSSFA